MESHVPVKSRSEVLRCVSVRISTLAITSKYGHEQMRFNARKECFVWPRVDCARTRESAMSVPWPYRERTLTVPWAYPDRTVSVPWAHCELNMTVSIVRIFFAQHIWGDFLCRSRFLSLLHNSIDLRNVNTVFSLGLKCIHSCTYEHRGYWQQWNTEEFTFKITFISINFRAVTEINSRFRTQKENVFVSTGLCD